MFAGRSTYIPLRLNNAGVISIIFAISILLLPQQALSWFGRGQVITASGLWGALQHGLQAFSAWLNVWFTPNGLLYNIVYFVLVVRLHVLLQLDRAQHARRSPTISRRLEPSSRASVPVNRR